MKSFDVLELTPLLPELCLFIGALFLLMFGAFQKDGAPVLVCRLAKVMMIGALGFVFILGDDTRSAFSGLFVSNSFTAFAKALVLVGSIFVMPLVTGYYRDYSKYLAFEIPVLMLLSVTGMLLMISSNSFLSLYMALELQSLPLYILAAVHRDSPRSSEAGLKYFVLGALASGLLLYGISLIYGFSGTVSFEGLSTLYTQEGSMPLGALVGLVLVLTALAFKLSAAPFHMWTPDVYEGSPTPITAFFAVAPKIAAVALFVRVVMEAFNGVTLEWQQIVAILAALSMAVGAFGALRQKSIKRLVAYSSIIHVGFILMGLVTATPEGIRSVLVYLSIYMVMTLGIFACMMLVRKKDHHLCEEIESFAGLSRTQPMLAACIAVIMFSMAGIPPMAGFFAKFFVIFAAVNANMLPLAVIAALSSVVAAYYYLRVVKVMYFDEPALLLDREARNEIRFVAAGAAAINLLFFLYFTPLLVAAESAAAALF